MSIATGQFSFATVLQVKMSKLIPDVENPGQWVASESDGDILELDSLRISNITTEGPTKEYRGGLYAKQQQRYGKTYRLEMEDVIGSLKMIKMFFGDTGSDANKVTLGNTYSNARYQIEGTTFVIDKATGTRKWVKITFFEFLPDENFNLNLEAEGEFAVFNLAGELLADDCSGNVLKIEDGSAPC